MTPEDQCRMTAGEAATYTLFLEWALIIVAMLMVTVLGLFAVLAVLTQGKHGVLIFIGAQTSTVGGTICLSYLQAMRHSGLNRRFWKRMLSNVNWNIYDAEVSYE